MADMICTCSAEGLRDAERMRIAVAQHLGIKPEELCLRIVDSIEKDFGAAWQVDCDQWFGVGVEAGEFSDYAECDLPLDGLASGWLQLAEHFPDKVPAKGGQLAEVEALSAQQLEAYVTARAAYDTHVASCADCDTKSGWKVCPSGKQLFDARVEAHRAIDLKWGLPNCEEHPAWWGDAPKKPVTPDE